MSTHCSVRVSLAGAITLALFGIATVATAQTVAPQQVPPPTMPAQPAQPMPAPPPPPPPTPPPAPANPAPPAQPATPMTAPQQQDATAGATGQFHQGTQSSAQYQLPDSNGGTLTVNSGMPANVQNYGPPPPFATLDTNHDGRISQAEAQAYPPLDSDFLYASGQGKTISRAQYQKWVQNQH